MAYSFDAFLAADPSNPANVAANAAITIFDPADPTHAPVTITDLTGLPLANPVTVNKNGFGPAFMHETLDRVGWAGGGFEGLFTSYEGMKAEAVAARAAAENAAANAGAEAAAVADAAIGDATAASTAAAASASAAEAAAAASATAAANSAALVGAPADSAIAAAINGSGTATKAALSATYAQRWKANTAYSAGDKATSPSGLPITAKTTFTSGATYDAANWDYVVVLNILDFGVVRGTASSQTAAIKAALDANPGAAFYFPPGDYRLDTGLVIGKSNSLVLAEGTRIYAGAAMTTMITYAKDTAGYTEDKSISGYGWLLDGNLNAQRILSVSKVIRFSVSGGNFKDGINRGLVTEAALGAELIASDLRFYNSGITNVTDNIAIEAKMGDSHYRDIIIRDWTTAVKDTAFNRWDRVHPWISQDSGANTQMTSRYPTSVGFDITGNSDLQACVSDTYRYAYKFRTNGTSYTAPARLLNCRAMWANNPILPTAIATANPAYVFDNTDGIGFISDRFTATGHSTVSGNFLTGPATGITTRNTFSYGYIIGAQGTAADSLDYRGGIQQGTFTFTPTIYGSTGAGTHTYSSRSGRMVVEGDTATYFVRIAGTLDSTTAFAGAMRIGGIPLPNGSTNVRDGSGSVGWVTNINASSAVIFNGTAPYVSVMTLGATGTTEVDIFGQSLRGKVVDIMLTVRVTHFKA